MPSCTHKTRVCQLERWGKPGNAHGSCHGPGGCRRRSRHRFSLTWNCNHLANANKKQHIAILNTRLHLAVPEISCVVSNFSRPGTAIIWPMPARVAYCHSEHPPAEIVTPLQLFRRRIHGFSGQKGAGTDNSD